jgi:isopenicillin-N N-acyltransferase like protein
VSVRVLRVEGDGRTRGQRVGAELAEPIRRSLAFYRRLLGSWSVDPDGLAHLLQPFREAAERAFPGYVTEIDGMAEASGVDPWELFAANAIEELEPLVSPAGARSEHCTAFVVRGEAGPILGHNEQWYAGDAGNVAVIVAAPDGGPAFASPTVVTCLPAVGMNASGSAQGVMSLVGDDDRVGIPRMFASRHGLEARNIDDAVARVTPPGRAGGYAHVFAFAAGEAWAVETSATAHATVDRRGVHTNHYLDHALAATSPPATASSRARFVRAEGLLADRSVSTPKEVMEVLRDHQGRPDSICAHPRPEDGQEAQAILFSMVCDVGERRMWVAPGNPCVTPFEELDLQAVVR